MLFMFSMLSIMFVMLICTGLTHHTPIRYNGSGERWFAPTDEAALSKPSFGMADSSRQQIVEKRMPPELLNTTLEQQILGNQTCTLHMYFLLSCQGIIKDEKGNRVWGAIGTPRNLRAFNGTNKNKQVNNTKAKTNTVTKHAYGGKMA